MPAGYPKMATRLTDVRDGDIWAVGNHTFACGDAQDGAVMDALVDGAVIDLVYADPPWNDGDARTWRTQSKRDGPVGNPVHTAQVVPAILRVAAERRLFAYVESGLPTLGQYKMILAGMGALVLADWTTWTSVNKKRSNALLAVAFGAVPDMVFPDFSGMADGLTPGVAMEHWAPTGTVLDPCCGLGFTSRNAEKEGWRSLNHELNPNRMARAMESLEDLTGRHAVLIERKN